MGSVNVQEENILVEIIKTICSDNCTFESLSTKIKEIISFCELQNHIGLHKTSVVDDKTASIMGLLLTDCPELSYEEQISLKNAVAMFLESKMNPLINEIKLLTNEKIFDSLECQYNQSIKLKEDEINNLQESINKKLSVIKEMQEKKINAVLDWLDFKLNSVLPFSENSVELYSVKSKMLNLKSKIIHLQILHTIFTETKYSVKAYGELEKDLKESIAASSKKINEYKQIINKEHK